jgi:hypothetical protein
METEPRIRMIRNPVGSRSTELAAPAESPFLGFPCSDPVETGPETWKI